MKCSLIDNCIGPFYPCHQCKKAVCKKCIICIIDNKFEDTRYNKITDASCPFCRVNFSYDAVSQFIGEETVAAYNTENKVKKFTMLENHNHNVEYFKQFNAGKVSTKHPISFKINYPTNNPMLANAINDLNKVYTQINGGRRSPP